MSATALLSPGSGLPTPQTHIFPGVSRLPWTAGFTLHREGGQGVWPPSLTPPCPVLGPGARPASPSHPEALAVLGRLWLPVQMGQEATGSNVGCGTEAEDGVGGWTMPVKGPHSPALPPGLQQGLQGLPVRKRAQRGSWVPPLAPLPRTPHTYLLSLCSRGPDHSLWEVASESPRPLLSPPPAVLGGQCDPGWGQGRKSPVQGSPWVQALL